jgi:hypothetical protein
VTACVVLRADSDEVPDAQVAAWYMLSEPVAGPSVNPGARGAAAAAGTAAAAHGDSQIHAEEAAEQQAKQGSVTYAQLVEDMIPMAGGRDGPPPALARNGEFSDWVYTIASEKYDRNEVRQEQGHCSARCMTSSQQ